MITRLGYRSAFAVLVASLSPSSATSDIPRDAPWTAAAVDSLLVSNAAGLRLLVDKSNSSPTLRIVLAGRDTSDRAIEVLFPEHLSARRRGVTEGEHLYSFRPGSQGSAPHWSRIVHALQYERDLPGVVHLLARATLEDDGVRFHYEFRNNSDVAYDMIYAVTDPRLTSIFHDERLERTYVHYPSGFELLAAETPQRLTLPRDRWLPARYLASYTWPVPRKRIEVIDGITHYNASRAVDLPVIATRSIDGQWVVASFTRTVGNVWSNPELTCQHVDPQVSLAPHSTAVTEVKLLVFRGGLNEVLGAVERQRQTLK